MLVTRSWGFACDLSRPETRPSRFSYPGVLPRLQTAAETRRSREGHREVPAALPSAPTGQGERETGAEGRRPATAAGGTQADRRVPLVHEEAAPVAGERAGTRGEQVPGGEPGGRGHQAPGGLPRHGGAQEGSRDAPTSQAADRRRHHPTPGAATRVSFCAFVFCRLSRYAWFRFRVCCVRACISAWLSVRSHMWIVPHVRAFVFCRWSRCARFRFRVCCVRACLSAWLSVRSHPWIVPHVRAFVFCRSSRYARFRFRVCLYAPAYPLDCRYVRTCELFRVCVRSCSVVYLVTRVFVFAFACTRLHIHLIAGTFASVNCSACAYVRVLSFISLRSFSFSRLLVRACISAWLSVRSHMWIVPRVRAFVFCRLSRYACFRFRVCLYAPAYPLYCWYVRIRELFRVCVRSCSIVYLVTRVFASACAVYTPAYPLDCWYVRTCELFRVCVRSCSVVLVTSVFVSACACACLLVRLIAGTFFRAYGVTIPRLFSLVLSYTFSYRVGQRVRAFRVYACVSFCAFDSLCIFPRVRICTCVCACTK